MSAIERVMRILEITNKKVREIFEEETRKEHSEAKAEAIKAEAEQNGHDEGFEPMTPAGLAEFTAPGPIGTVPREGIPEGLKVETSHEETSEEEASHEEPAEGSRGWKSHLIRKFFKENPGAKNKDFIEHYAKMGIDIKPSLVSTVRGASEKKEKKRGRPAGKKSAKATATAKKRSGLTMMAAAAKVVSRSKDGLRVDEILKGVKKYHSYGGEQGDKGMKNCLNQALYALSQKKSHRGWKGSTPVILHDKDSHTWRLNPKAERQTA